MIDVATIRSWIEESGYRAHLEEPSTIRVRTRERGIVPLPPFFVQCTEAWVVLTMFGLFDTSRGPSSAPPSSKADLREGALLRALLEANREMRTAKFALDENDEVVLAAELPTESLDRSELADAVERMIEYATTYRRRLAGERA